jgi:hypothetical protein
MADEPQPPGKRPDLGAPGSDGQPNLSRPCTRFDRVDWLAFAVTVVVLSSVYFDTMAPEVTLEYSGMLATGAMYAAVPNPPGYPVWTIYSWLFVTLLPFSNVASARPWPRRWLAEWLP